MNGNAEYKAISGCSAVPVEQGGGTGTRCSHWSEACLQTELMTGYLNSGVLAPLSRITIASLRDLGYSVNYAAADFYGRRNLGAGCTCNRRRSLRDSHDDDSDTHQIGLSLPDTQTLSPDLHKVARNYGQSILDQRAATQNTLQNAPQNTPRDDGHPTYIGDKVVSVIVTDGVGIFSVLVTR